MKPMQRRPLMKGILAAAAAPMFIPARLLGKDAPSSRITLGCIGLGGHGVEVNVNSFLHEETARIVSVCDVFKSRRENVRTLVNEHYGTSDCRSVADFREIIADPAIDAVVISTPDHWHVPISLMALEAGKNVFCEKPTLTMGEGRELADAVKTHGAVFQAALEDRSLIHYHKMVEWVLNGAIGTLKKIDVVLPKGFIYPEEAESPVPEDLDYGMWLGPAPFSPYTKSRTDAMVWRMIRDYSAGMLLDWGTHLVDTAQLAADAPGGCAVEVEGSGLVPENSLTNVPVEFDLRYRYANDVAMHVRSSDLDGLGSSVSLRFEGTSGWIERKGWGGALAAADPEILRTRYTPETTKLWPLPPREHQNFIDCIRSGKPTTYTAETLRELCATLHMGAIAIETGQKLKWDQKMDRFDNEAANQLCSRTRREDWKTGR